MLHDMIAKGITIDVTNRDDITSFFQVHGEAATLMLLKQVEKIQQEHESEGSPPIKANSKFKELVRWYIKKKRTEQVRSDSDAEWQATKQRAIESKRRGYVPTRATIKKQLDEMVDKGEISIQEYEWGMRGLPLVHDLVEQAQADDVPF